MTPAFDKGLVVGGTGMLAQASEWIAAQCQNLTLVARHPDALAAKLGATPLQLDWADPDAADRIAALPSDFDLVLTWVHDAAAGLVRPCEDRLKPGGRSIRVHGSLSADLQTRAARDPNPRPDIARQVVILGWHPEPGGGKRWLSNDEISAGVIAAIREPVFEALTIGGASG
ncbi:hypothetical protein E2K80_13110 [Rhodophyticola sp. CCM32]|uniref:hypothetical protein n=1 Tax=Rhodophyticola sp. CCM32 TaxID=2916397 RepID=UPI00107FCF41|nr:hypothetical protein [Rhodophyticola sp. CCM32]QBY01547.1 hypothetical protein E2K80_13110 [Rhodophyticola sp. CCM32]